MATRTVQITTCDICQREDEGIVHYSVTREGSVTTIDLCSTCGEGFEHMLVAHGYTSRNGKKPVKGGVDFNAVRAWARENGITVSERGRVADSVVDAYINRAPATAPVLAVVREKEETPEETPETASAPAPAPKPRRNRTTTK